MAKRSKPTDDSDSPWKDALQAYFPFFLAFFFPDIHQDIDWARGYEALDKEFQQIVRRAKLGKRLADKLFKIWLRDGSDCWILIHVEIQSEVEKEFPRRMFEYHLAIRRLYNREVVGLALLCDDNPDWKPTKFVSERWGCGIELTFRIAKLLNYRGSLEALERSQNPIATVVAANLEAMRTRDDPAQRKDGKLRLAKGLLQRNWSADDIRELLRLIDWLMTLPEDLDDEFENEFHEYEKEREVAYVTSFERSGIKKGRREGLREGLLIGIALAVKAQFGRSGPKLMAKVNTLDLEGLQKFVRFLETAETIDGVREYLSKTSE